MSEKAIIIKDLSKRYRIGKEEERHDTFAGMVSDWLLSPIRNYRELRQLTKFTSEQEREDVIWALDGVSFEVDRGEVVGVIGRNGAGKSTLLKILSKITYPTSGSAELSGRVSSLLEVGTGFHPELTGRDNVYLNGTILGMSKAEIDEKFNEIVEFSGIRKFIDTPVKRYSSGMRVRLAFSIAAHLEPEILLVDEVLAVGDAEFQDKCLGKMNAVAEVGRTVIFISHDMSAVSRLCRRGIWLDEGKIRKDGPMDEVIQAYLFSSSNQSNPKLHFPAQEGKAAQILSLTVRDFQGNHTLTHLNIHPFSIGVRYQLATELTNYRVGIKIRTPDGLEVLNWTNTDIKNEIWSDPPGTYDVSIEIPGHILKPGKYLITVFLGQPGVKQHDKKENALALSLEGEIHKGQGLIVTPLAWEKVKI